MPSFAVRIKPCMITTVIPASLLSHLAKLLESIFRHVTNERCCCWGLQTTLISRTDVISTYLFLGPIFKYNLIPQTKISDTDACIKFSTT